MAKRKDGSAVVAVREETDNGELIAVIERDGYALDFDDAAGLTPKNPWAFRDEFYREYCSDEFRALLHLGFRDPTEPMSDSVRFLHAIASSFVKSLSGNPDIEILRGALASEPDPEDTARLIASVPFMNGAELIDADWLETIRKKLNAAFSGEISSFSGSVADFFASRSPELHLVGRVYFHLVENRKDEVPFAFMATYSSGRTREGKSKHLPLKNALIEYGDDRKRLLELLSTVNRAAEKSALVAEFMKSGEIFHPLRLAANEAYMFLKEIPLYEEAGILCRIPDWWKNRTGSFRVSIRLGERKPSVLGFDSLVDFDVGLSMGGERISEEELKKLTVETDGLAFIKGRWIEVDHDRLAAAIEAFENARAYTEGGGLSLIDAMRFRLNASGLLKVPEEAAELEITNGEWLSSVIESLVRPDAVDSVTCGLDFRAELREYQKQGLAWLSSMKRLNLGACLADDMGLGKTVQVIALLNQAGTGTQEKTLLVIPASLIGNWTIELDRFAPSLKYRVLHPSAGSAISGQPDAADGLPADYDLFITTYGMLSRLPWLSDVVWDTLVLDEAQAIKNPGAGQTKRVKQLKSKYRIAMTGTPIENRLSDLWSLFDFLNRGLLGNSREFTGFTKRLADDREKYSRLKAVVGPFILRRLKTDPSVIADLPEKVEMKTYSTLSKKQAALYAELVDEVRMKLESGREGIERKGLILSSLLKFKQICNHPGQYLGQDVFDERDSGKYGRLREICETIREKRERMLVFTQFREMTGPLMEFLETVFHHRGLVLHGGTPVAKRKALVDVFQGREYVPFLVLSVKAGGVGLNLTAANHVVHFDRWWNPAVENQATDRAFRIGQKKNVVVHKFITKGTVEEKIDALIEEKTRLSREIVPDSKENWITEMDNGQLMELFRLTV